MLFMIKTEAANMKFFSVNVTVKQSPSRTSPDKLAHIGKHEELLAAPIDPSIDKWFFISGAAAWVLP